MKLHLTETLGSLRSHFVFLRVKCFFISQRISGTNENDSKSPHPNENDLNKIRISLESSDVHHVGKTTKSGQQKATPLPSAKSHAACSASFTLYHVDNRLRPTNQTIECVL